MINPRKQVQIGDLSFSVFKFSGFVWLYIYNKKYSIFLKINTDAFKIISSKIAAITTKNQPANNKRSLEKHIVGFTKQIINYSFIKIKFSGKGYKIKKNNNNNILLLFNRAHITNIWWKNIIIKKLKKYKIYIKHTGFYSGIVYNIINTRPINIFTKKGLRKSRQTLFKKKGKK